jgi:hypothetical protein
MNTHPHSTSRKMVLQKSELARFIHPWVVLLFVLFCATQLFAEIPVLPGGGGGDTNEIILDSWSFGDTNYWTSDLGYSPISFGNLEVGTNGPGNSLLIDSPTNSWLVFNVWESSGATNLNVAGDGSVMFWFAPTSWASTSDTNDPGTTGPGEYGRLLEVGNYTTDASYYGGYVSDSTHTSVPVLWAAYMGQSIASGYNDMLRLGTGAEEGTVTGFAQDLGRAGGIVLTVAGPADAAAAKLAPAEAAAPKVAPEAAPAPTAKPSLPDEYWKNKQAPTQTTPGTKETVDMKPSSRSQGETYKRTTYYDEYGRSTGQTHETAHGEPDVHPNPHHHLRDPKTGQQSGPIPGAHPSSTPSQPTSTPPAANIPSED